MADARLRVFQATVDTAALHQRSETSGCIIYSVSPSCASYALRKTATDNQGEFDIQMIDTLNRNFYVDDCLKSVPSVENALNIVQELPKLLERGGFHLKVDFESLGSNECLSKRRSSNYCGLRSGQATRKSCFGSAMGC